MCPVLQGWTITLSQGCYHLFKSVMRQEVLSGGWGRQWFDSNTQRSRAVEKISQRNGIPKYVRQMKIIAAPVYSKPLCWWWKRIYLQCRRPRFDSWVGKVPWRRKWQPTQGSLPGKFHGQRSLAGYSPWDCKESDRTEWLTQNIKEGGLRLTSGMQTLCTIQIDVASGKPSLSSHLLTDYLMRMSNT